MPDRKTLAKWQARRPGFADDLWQARFDGDGAQTGRKTLRTPELLDAIYLRLCELGALSRVCAEPGMPNVRTVRDWARLIPRFGEALEVARDIDHERRADAAIGDLKAYFRELAAEAQARRRARDR